MDRIRIATRRSPLAIAQANLVAERLRSLSSEEIETDLVPLDTRGDQQRRSGADVAVGGKGVFTEALEDALSAGRADIGVHSMKDVPVTLPDGFALHTFGQRADPRDALVANQPGGSLATLPAGARVGTSSARRRCLLANLRGDLQVVPLRGNVDTRLGRLREGEFDAVLLACAGLDRLSLAARIDQRLDADVLVPAPGQGAIAVEYLADRKDVHSYIAAGINENVERQVTAEREVVRCLGADCAAPFAAYCMTVVNSERHALRLFAVAADANGERLLRVETSGDDPLALGAEAAARLMALGFQSLQQ